jgi:hypothetical protein
MLVPKRHGHSVARGRYDDKTPVDMKRPVIEALPAVPVVFVKIRVKTPVVQLTPPGERWGQKNTGLNARQN